MKSKEELKSLNQQERDELEIVFCLFEFVVENIETDQRINGIVGIYLDDTSDYINDADGLKNAIDAINELLDNTYESSHREDFMLMQIKRYYGITNLDCK